MKFKQANSGFTLIEMLLAFTIFALMGMAGFSILNNTVNSNEASIKHSEALNKLQRSMLIIERDLMQMAHRMVRVQGEIKPQPRTIAHGELILESESEVLAFRRNGWLNPLNILPRSQIQSLAYRVRDEQLERLYFNYPDPVKGEDYKIQVLMDQVKSLHFEFYDSNSKKWLTEWSEAKLPGGIKIVIEHTDLGALERVFALAGGNFKSGGSLNDATQ
ncbi:type II secretion system minor pseudopilin GspJ [Gayadomonas joobiniege]|uniref:type II secretion system minor pseudopilin GspJ n=1 Tax=Gayadomonas joobiniege TaxID=1234606 RepID=UPI0003796A77|nr:type II secretion system minor pseudopilin GspJ [Gayadomonas joobiniege]